MSPFLRIACLLWVLEFSVSFGRSEEAWQAPHMQVAEGFELSIAAAPPLVQYPMMACLDSEGRLYIAESDGRNLTTREEIERERPRFVRRLVDTDDDGVFDQSTIFADAMTMPEGGLWHDGALFIISPPYLWRLQDLDDDGVADVREQILGSMNFDGRANQHGPYAGPDGRLYFTGGHFGYTFAGRDGSRTGTSRAAGVFSCFPDGTDVRIDGQGGINPVDAVWSPQGDLFTTCAIFDSHGGRHDALIHWLRGGLTQRVYGESLLYDTGQRLPATVRWGQVAPAGLVRYRGTQFGEAYRANLFACHFNTQSVKRIRLRATGASFVSEEADFLTSPHGDVHFTDILEDADGSLLVLDTGGWLSWGCPHSQIAKPQVKGAIYRIRKRDGAMIGDPRGLKLDWRAPSPASVVARLGDARSAVRDRAREALLALGVPAVTALNAAYPQASVLEQERMLWILSRLGTEAARETLRAALLANEAGIRQVAATALGNLSDSMSLAPLLALIGSDPSLAVRRSAATALGQLGMVSATDPLMAAMEATTELHLRHAITYALMEIGTSEALANYLSDEAEPHHQVLSLRVHAATDPNKLQASRVMALLNASHAEVRQEAQRVIASQPAWQVELLALFRQLMAETEWSPRQRLLLDGLVVASVQKKAFQHAMTEVLHAPDMPLAAKRALLESWQFVPDLPEDLQPLAVLPVIEPAMSELLSVGLTLMRKFDLAKHEEFREKVMHLAYDGKLASELRVQALEVIAHQDRELRPKMFAFLQRRIQDPVVSPIDRRRAAQVLAFLDIDLLEKATLMQYINLIETSSPLERDVLLTPLLSAAVRKEFIADGLGKALATQAASLSTVQMQNLRTAFPDNDAIRSISERNEIAHEDRGQRLNVLLESLPTGNASRGKILFHETKATCTLCHRVGNAGGRLGPDLSHIGAIRNRRDLLEAIVFPNATIVNGYENYLITSKDGSTHAGLVHRQSREYVYMIGIDQQEQRLSRDRIQDMKRSPISVMPPGLEQLFSQEALADLIAYLEGCH